MAANGKIVLDADHGKIDKAADRTKKKYQDIGKGAQTVGSEMQKWGKQAANTLVGVSAILQGIRAAGRELQRQRQEAASTSKAKGQELLERGKSVRALGLDIATGGADRGLASVTSTGMVDQSRIDSFIGGLARMKKGERPSPRNVLQGVALLQSGLFDEAEISEAMKSPAKLRKLQGETQSRQARLSFAERREMATQFFERQADTQATAAISARGQDPRIMAAIQQRQDANNPLGALFYNTVGAVPGVGELSGIARDVGTTGQSYREGSDVARMARDMKIVAENTKQIPRPNHNPNAGGDG